MTSLLQKAFKVLALSLLCLVSLVSLPKQVHAADGTQDILLHKRIFRDMHADDNYVFRNNGRSIHEATSEFMQTTFGLNKATFAVFDITKKYDELAKEGQSYDELADGFFSNNNLPRKDMEALVDTKDARHQEVLKNPKYAFLLNDKGQPNVVASGITHSGEFVDSDGQTHSEDGLLRFKLNKKVTIDGQSTDARYLLVEIDVGLTENVDYDRLARYTIMKFPAIDEVTGKAFTDTVHIYPKNIGYARDPYFLKIGKSTAATPDTQAKPLEGAKFVLWHEVDGVKRYLDMSYESALQNVWISENDLQGGTALDDPRVTVFTSQSNGLVTMEGRLLAAGTYYFEEVSTIPGYTIDAEAMRVKVEVPRTWDEPVLVNGQALQEPEPQNPQIGDANVPLVYNYQDGTPPTDTDDPSTPDTPDTPNTSKPGTPIDVSSKPSTPATNTAPKLLGFLPQTGNALMNGLIILGILLILIVLIYRWRRRKRMKD